MNSDIYMMYRNTRVYFLESGYFCKFNEGQIMVDADGAPNAYGPPRYKGDPDGCGLDSLTAACYPPGAADPLGQEDWTGILIPDPQNPKVPFLKPDGFYISQTSLCDASKGDREPGKFIDATTVPYIVLPQFWLDHLGMKLGDLAVLMHPKVAKPVVMIIGDVCPFTERLGEMSIAAALALGASEASPIDGTVIPRGKILCRFFRNSRPKDLWPLTSEKLQAFLPELAKKHNFDPADPKSYGKGVIKTDTDQ